MRRLFFSAAVNRRPYSPRSSLNQRVVRGMSPGCSEKFPNRVNGCSSRRKTVRSAESFRRNLVSDKRNLYRETNRASLTKPVPWFSLAHAALLAASAVWPKRRGLVVILGEARKTLGVLAR